MGVRCFMIEPAMKARRSLRRYQSSQDNPQEACAASGMGYHNAHTALGDVPAARVPRYESWVWDFGERLDLPHDDARWPATCACGYAFKETDECQVFHDIVWRAADGREFGERDLPPGAMRDMAFTGMDKFMPKPSPDGMALYVVLPCGHEWFIDGRANNGPMGWTRTGTPPTISVTPSILCGSTCYHGFLTNGELNP